MPITATEWAAGRIEPDEERPDPEPVSESPSPEGEIRSFLETNDQIAFSRAEIVRGAQCSRIARSDGEPVIYYLIARGETEACASSSDCSP